MPWQRLTLVLGCLILAGLSQAQTTIWENEVEKSVVLIQTFTQRPDYKSPWKMKFVSSGSGSGFLIEGNRLLTNAHVVSDARQILVKKASSPQPWLADVTFVAHDSDLALLSVRDPQFYEDMAPLSFGKLPERQTHVRTYGYPAGGERISRTEGVVSRIEFGTYVHSSVDSHLLIQTDSAINPGNSGGPVIQNGQVVGVAFQSNPTLNDVGYFIPVQLIERFLQDVQDGHYDGVPEIGAQINHLLNPHHRAYLKLPPDLQGVVVDRVLEKSAAEGLLQPGDVLLEIEGDPINGAGQVNYEGHPVMLHIHAENKQIGDPLNFKVWRDQTVMSVTLTLMPPPFQDDVRLAYDVLPQYLIYGGLVFVPLNRNYFSSVGSSDPPLVYEHFYREQEKPGTRREQTVVMMRVLPATVNAGYAQITNYILDTLNGQRVSSLKHLSELLEHNNHSSHMVFESQWNQLPIVLDTEQVEGTQQQVLQQYGIKQEMRL